MNDQFLYILFKYRTGIHMKIGCSKLTYIQIQFDRDMQDRVELDTEVFRRAIYDHLILLKREKPNPGHP